MANSSVSTKFDVRPKKQGPECRLDKSDMQDRGLDKGHPSMYLRKQYARVDQFNRAYCSAHTPAGSAREAHKGSATVGWWDEACNWSNGLEA